MSKFILHEEWLVELVAEFEAKIIEKAALDTSSMIYTGNFKVIVEIVKD